MFFTTNNTSFLLAFIVDPIIFIGLSSNGLSKKWNFYPLKKVTAVSNFIIRNENGIFHKPFMCLLLQIASSNLWL